MNLDACDMICLKTRILRFLILLQKNPILFMLEVPVSSIISKRQNLEDYMQRFYKIGYSVSYVIYDEMGFSGYPMVGRDML